MKPEEEFDKRIAAIHGLNNSASYPQSVGAEALDSRHAEFQAMAEVFLGEDFDQAKLGRVESMQIALHEQQAVLYRRYETGELSPKKYVELFNTLLDCTFEVCETILGAEDFLKLFGCPRSELAGFIDKEAFLQAHQTR